MSDSGEGTGHWAGHRVPAIVSGARVPEPTVRSRRLLVEAVQALGAFHESLVVVGAHAVMFHAERIGHRPDSTADADAVLNPLLVAASPNILELMYAAGFEAASPDRPGIYGYVGESGISQRQRTTVDLIVPEAYAGAGRRAARVPGQKNALSRAVGLELALWDRVPATISTVPGDGEPISADVWMAGQGALLVAKAHKVSDRLGELRVRPHRLRPKDSGDVGLLMLASDPGEVAQRLLGVTEAHPETLDIARIGMRFIADHYRSGSRVSLLRSHLIDSFTDLPAIGGRVDEWIDEFRAEAGWLL